MKYAIVLFLTGLFMITSCENDLEKVNALFSKDQTKVEEARNVQLLYSDSAIVRVRVNGPRMLRHLDHSNPIEEFPEGVRVEFISSNSSAKTKGELTAKYAIRYETKGEIIVRDSVVWISGKGEKLETSELTWNDEDKTVYTRQFVKITKQDEIFQGFGFEADQEFNHWKINHLTGKMMVEGLE